MSAPDIVLRLPLPSCERFGETAIDAYAGARSMGLSSVEVVTDPVTRTYVIRAWYRNQFDPGRAAVFMGSVG